MYAQLPTVYQDNDSALDYPLLRFLSLLGDQADDIETLFRRFSGESGTSDLVDPVTADGSWIPWLAQITGVERGDLTIAQLREVVADANDNRADGSIPAIAAQIRPLLTGDAYLIIARHHLGDVWLIGIFTLEAESAGTTAAEILAQASLQKPAGVVFVHDFGLAWSDLEAGYPTWTAIEAAGSWAGLVP